MHFTLLVAGALLPEELAAALTASLDTPELKKRLARASMIENGVSAPGNADAHLDWLANKLFGHPPPAPTAPYAYAQLADSTSKLHVWHADPVHIEVARDHLMVHSLGADAPTAEESTQLLAAANELASESGCEFTIAGECWFLLTDRDWAIDVPPLASVIEAPVAMPTGRDALIWNRLHNEVQMTWHAHPVNEARERNGVRTINALWLHGGGRWKPLPAIEFAQVQSDATEWQGVARAAGARGVPLSAPVVDDALVVIDEAALYRRRQDWAAWSQTITALDRRLSQHSDDAIDLIFSGNSLRTFGLRPSDRYKPWRQRTLAKAFTE